MSPTLKTPFWSGARTKQHMQTYKGGKQAPERRRAKRKAGVPKQHAHMQSNRLRGKQQKIHRETRYEIWLKAWSHNPTRQACYLSLAALNCKCWQKTRVQIRASPAGDQSVAVPPSCDSTGFWQCLGFLKELFQSDVAFGECSAIYCCWSITYMRQVSILNPRKGFSHKVNYRIT